MATGVAQVDHLSIDDDEAPDGGRQRLPQVLKCSPVKCRITDSTQIQRQQRVCTHYQFQALSGSADVKGR